MEFISRTCCGLEKSATCSCRALKLANIATFDGPGDGRRNERQYNNAQAELKDLVLNACEANHHGHHAKSTSCC